MRRAIIVAGLALLGAAPTLQACSGASEQEDYSDESPSQTQFDDDAAREEATSAVEDQSFEDVGDTSDCTIDCSGHDAGFEWAKEQGVTDASECGGNSPSFEEGCEAYATAIEERVQEQRGEADSGHSEE